MPASRKRGGAKAHRKRVNKTNQVKKAQASAMQKLFNESIRLQIEEMKKKIETSGETENS